MPRLALNEFQNAESVAYEFKRHEYYNLYDYIFVVFFFFFWSSSFLISYFCVLCETAWVYVKIVSPVSFLCDVNKRYVLCIIYGLMMYRATEKKKRKQCKQITNITI